MRLTGILIALQLLASAAFCQSAPTICPIKDFNGRTSEFGKRMHPMFQTQQDHRAIDFYVAEGTPVLATADGTVLQADTVEAYGVVVRIQHKDRIETFYAHLSSLVVTAGETVKQGDIIGYSGNSGLSTGPHLHYEVVKNGVSVNPRDFMP